MHRRFEIKFSFQLDLYAWKTITARHNHNNPIPNELNDNFRFAQNQILDIVSSQKILQHNFCVALTKMNAIQIYYR